MKRQIAEGLRSALPIWPRPIRTHFSMSSADRDNVSGIGNSQTLTILIERQPDGEYAAIHEANHDLG